MFKKLLPLLFLFAGFQANAAIITIDYDLSSSQYVSSQSGLSGQFDIADSLNSSVYSIPYDIYGARLSISTSDDANDGGFAYQSSGSNTTGWSGYTRFQNSRCIDDHDCDWNRSYSNYGNTTYKSEEERYHIAYNGDNFADSATSNTYERLFTRGQDYYKNEDVAYSNITGTCISHPTSYTCTKADWVDHHIWDYEAKTYYDFVLDRQGSRWLSGAAISTLNGTGLMDFDLTSTLGDFFVDGLSLILYINETPPQTTVPEPSIIALFTLGLVGLGLPRRRQS
jgi:hypothetical protein